MPGHGGTRANAGAPRGGVSETRRRLIAAIESGVEMAGRNKGLEGTREEVIEQTGAHMVCDLILAGNVRDILAIWGQNVTKGSNEAGNESKKGGLVGALKQASNMLNKNVIGTNSGQTTEQGSDNQSTATTLSNSTMDTESIAPLERDKNEMMFIPQKSLALELPTEEPASQEGATPTPAPSHITYMVESENLEKNSENSDSEK